MNQGFGLAASFTTAAEVAGFAVKSTAMALPGRLRTTIWLRGTMPLPWASVAGGRATVTVLENPVASVTLQSKL